MTDEEIIEYFINTETMHIVSSRINKFQLAKHNDFKEYLENRYDDFEGKYTEIVTRIYFKIDEIPRCPVCGKN